jgi:predicted ATPase
VTLVGAGGIGKTQLGIEVARVQSMNSGAEVCFVALGSNDAPGHVVKAVASALRIELFGQDVSLSDVTAAVAGRELLLVLDNCEHVINEAAALCEYLVRADNRIRILATSREPVRTACEQLFWVPPLELPHEGDDLEALTQRGAVQMFLARARAFDPHFTYDGESIAQIATVCRRLDGVPLALELAAARAATLGIPELVCELEDRFRILTGGLRSAPLRQQTLKATLDWSYRFLSQSERIVLRRVSVFDGHFPLEVACRIAACDDLSEGEVTEAIAGLASKSLLMFDSNGPRKMYYMLESTRLYAMQDLDDPHERANVGARHEAYGVPWTFSDHLNGAGHLAQ